MSLKATGWNTYSGMRAICRVVAVSFILAMPSLRCESANDQSSSGATRQVASTAEMIAARTDVWGDAAMRQPDGASYEFFRDLLPPLRWVNAEFRHYPIVLSAPRAAQKTRLVSNGSAVNAKANKAPMWFELGVPVKFFIGDPAVPFGDDLARLETPAYLDGYLPVVTIRYKSAAATYCEEVFAPVEEKFASCGSTMLRFSLGKNGSRSGRIEARVGSRTALHAQNGQVLDKNGQSLVAFGPEWRWQ